MTPSSSHRLIVSFNLGIKADGRGYCGLNIITFGSVSKRITASGKGQYDLGGMFSFCFKNGLIFS